MTTNGQQVQNMFDIAQMFTHTERITLRIWFDLDSAGKDVDADRLLQAGLILEHFQSRLPDDPAARTPEMLAKVAELEQAFQNEVQLAQGILTDKVKQTIVNGPIVTETRSFNG